MGHEDEYLKLKLNCYSYKLHLNSESVGHIRWQVPPQSSESKTPAGIRLDLVMKSKNVNGTTTRF
jgi:hypothetical protein